MTRAAVVRERLFVRSSADRAFALAGAAVLTGASLAPLYHVVDVVGGPGGLGLFVVLVVGALGLAAVFGQTLRLPAAAALGSLLLAVGLGGYLLAVPEATLDFNRQFRDTVALVTGLSVLRMTKAAVWALGFTPGPLFVSTYLFLRRRYALGVLIAGSTLAFFISTGDVDVLHGLVGALGAVATLGFGRLDREGGTSPQRDAVVVLLVAVLVVTTSLSVVPGGAARPLLPDDRGETVESSLVGGADSVTVRGSIELSPTVRFTVEADRPARWRVGAFDRYTGNGWVRSGQSRPLEEPLRRPVGQSTDRLLQTYRVESEMAVMPAAWKPARVVEGAAGVRVTSMGALEPRGTFEPNDEYTVVSYQHQPTPDELRSAGTDYPVGLPDRFTQLPESTPERVGEFTTRLTAEADNPYDTARVIERWLQTNKEYSLDVDRPSGDVAASFIFEMDRGYCTYYASAMVAMLRTQGIPARFVVGYTTGESVDENRWAVRGLDSHAWVEVYFPGHGWVAFDPTPAGPRQAAEQAQLEQAEAAGVEGVTVDTPAVVETPAPGGDSGQTAIPEGVLDPENVEDIDENPTPPAGLGAVDGGTGGTGDGGLGSRLPDEQTVLYGLILLIGAATAAQRTGLLAWSRREVWVRRPPEGPPVRRIEVTFERLDYLLGRRYRARRPAETPRAYLLALRSRFGTTHTAGASTGPHDPRLDQLFDLYERAHYAGRGSAAEADRAWQLLCELREEWTVGS